MRRFRLRTALLCASWVAWSASGCASKPPKPVPAVATLSIVARPDANPDASGRPSPIVLRLYQLKADAAFVDSDFFPLFDDDKRALGADLVSREEMELAPGEARALEVHCRARRVPRRGQREVAGDCPGAREQGQAHPRRDRGRARARDRVRHPMMQRQACHYDARPAGRWPAAVYRSPPVSG